MRHFTYFHGNASIVGFGSGAFQVNVFVPDDAPWGNAVPVVPVVFTLWNISRPGTSTVAIQ
jgi:hypothetical protein